MHEESPPPFIVIRTPARAAKPDPYQRALELVGAVHAITQTAGTRFYLRDRLDRAATGLVFELRRAATDVPRIRWKHYRAAQTHAGVVATVLDILLHQKAAAPEEIEAAGALVRELLADIEPLTTG